MYLLAGQSNMAGRGLLDDLYSSKTRDYLLRLAPDFEYDKFVSSVRSSTYSYNPNRGWGNHG